MVMAGVALVATADREQQLAEIVTRDRILARLADEHAVDTPSAVATYDRYAKLLSKNPIEGRNHTMERLAGFRGTPEEVAMLIRSCLAVSQADRDFSSAERSVVEEICRVLGADPHEFGVYDI